MAQKSNSVNTPILSEVKRSFTEINQAIISHTKWLAELTMQLVCDIQQNNKSTSLQSHSECSFGQWYYGKHAAFLYLKPNFIAIEELHCVMHSRMQAIMKNDKKGKDVTHADYEVFIDSEASFSKALVNLRDELYELLLSFDYLTGVLNRQAFYPILEKEYARVKRFNEPCCIAVLDIDKFKNINDKFGHAAGDEVLISIVDFVLVNIRPYDSICRYGGEEFLILLPQTTVEIAYVIVDRIRQQLHQKKISISDDNYIAVSASFGIAPMSADKEIKETIQYADQALYLAKENGRNRVEVWVKSDVPVETVIQ